VSPARLSGLRVLVESGDRRFLRLAAFLVSRRGHQVTAVRGTEQTLDAIDGQGADALVVDAGYAPSTAAGLIATVSTLHPSVRVILVLDGAQAEAACGFQVMGKWDAAASLAPAVEGRLQQLDGRVPSTAASRN
jgi:DNA-binding NtrC family response regulator